MAAVTSLGVALTHRAHAHGVLFITGHAKQGATDAVDWVALSHTAAQAKLTLVIYMGLGQVAPICAELVRHGLPADTPAAIVERATSPDQRVVTATLASLPALAQSHQLESPSLIIVGSVVLLRAAVGLQRIDAQACACSGGMPAFS